MTKAVPFTELSIARAIRGIEKAGRFAVGMRPDGTLIIGDKPVDTSSFVPALVQNDPASEWEDQRG